MDDFTDNITVRYCKTLNRVLCTAAERHIIAKDKFQFYCHFFLNNKQLFNLIYPITFDGDKTRAKLYWNLIFRIQDELTWYDPTHANHYAYIIDRLVKNAVYRFWLSPDDSGSVHSAVLASRPCINILLEAYFFSNRINSSEKRFVKCKAWKEVLEQINACADLC